MFRCGVVRTSAAFASAFLLSTALTGECQAQVGPSRPISPGTSSGSSLPPLQRLPESRSPSPPFSPGLSPLNGSVPKGQPTGGTLALSLRDAIAGGLQYNLRVISSRQSDRTAAAARLAALSLLLPNIGGRVTEASQQINLKALGFSGFPGLPTIVGPFAVFDARASLTQSIFSASSLAGYRSFKQDERTARFSLQDTRDAVVLLVVSLYLQAVAEAARVNTATAQVALAQAALEQARTMNQTGVAAGIDVLRAQVELQSEQNRLTTNEVEYRKDLLNLGRAIGMPEGQEILLTDTIPFSPDPPISQAEAIRQALDTRSDYKAAQAAESSADLLKSAAEKQRLPSVFFNGDYGAIGPSPSDSHGTYTAAVGVEFPIFTGGRIRSDVDRANALLQQRQAESADLRARIDYQVRTAFLDLNASRDRVSVAQSTVQLAAQQLIQSRDRFRAGVADNLEVVQAQAANAAANEEYISSLFAYNLSKASLARAVGNINDTVLVYLGVPAR
jgi:outer membrane protein TolC